MFGSANHRYTIEEPDLQTLADDIEAAGARFGGVDVIGEWRAAVPGSVESVVYRTQDPTGPFSRPMLARLDGRYPMNAGEVAITDGVAATLQVAIGDIVDLDGRARIVVGVIENPSDLDDEFALVAPSQLEDSEAVTLLIGGTGAFDEVRAIREFGGVHFPTADLTSRGDVKRVQTAAVVVGVAAVVLVLVSLVASAGFIAVAHRRLRQLGMLSAVGATQRHLRLVVIANGVLVGGVAAALGAVLGIGGWLIAAPSMEDAAGFRIDSWNVPWPLVAATMVAGAAHDDSGGVVAGAVGVDGAHHRRPVGSTPSAAAGPPLGDRRRPHRARSDSVCCSRRGTAQRSSPSARSPRSPAY